MAEKPNIPSTLAPHKQQWKTSYQAMNHPSEPIPPTHYVSTVPNDDENDGNVIGLSVLSVLSRNLDILASLPGNPVRTMPPFFGYC